MAVPRRVAGSEWRVALQFRGAEGRGLAHANTERRAVSIAIAAGDSAQDRGASGHTDHRNDPEAAAVRVIRGGRAGCGGTGSEHVDADGRAIHQTLEDTHGPG